MRTVVLTQETKKDLLDSLLKRSPNNYDSYTDTVNEIVNTVRKGGDQALHDYTLKFDKVDISAGQMIVTEDEIKEAYSLVEPEVVEVIKKSAENIRVYHEKQKQYSWFDSKPDGTILGQKISEMNTGELKNFGWEFEVGHRNKIGDVSYNVNANLSIIKNKLTTLGVGNVEQLNGMVGNGSDLFIGYPIQMYYGYVSDGVFLDENDIKSWYDQSKVTPNPQPGDIRYRDLNNDGKIDVNDVTYIGFPETPRVTYGFSGFVNYSNFEFSFAFQGSGKRSFFMDPSELSPFVDDHAMLTAIYKDHWSEDNMIRKPFWPRLSTQNLIEHSPEEDWYNKNATEVRKSTYFMRECRFLRCTSLELAYNMPKKLMERWGLQNMKFFVRANNPFLISNFKLWDVELGEDAFNYPIQKTYTVGLNFSF